MYSKFGIVFLFTIQVAGLMSEAYIAQHDRLVFS